MNRKNILMMDKIISNIMNIRNQTKNNISLIEYLTSSILNSITVIKNLFQQLDYVPYIVQRDGTVEKDESSYVRNIATLYDLLRFNLEKDGVLYQLILDNLEILKPSVEDSISYKKEIFIGYSSLGFYLLCLLHLSDKEKSENEELVKNIKRFLFKNLEKIKDTKFELPECLIALCYCFPTEEEKEILYKKLYKLIKESQQEENLRESIFQINWISKYIYTLKQTIGLPSDFRMDSVSYLKDKMINFKKVFKKLKTNEIAVCFEGLSSLQYLTPNDKETFLQIYDLLEELKKRRKHFLFYFLNDTARIDITGHVLNGYYVLLLLEKRKME